jgi:hypothetical protein
MVATCGESGIGRGVRYAGGRLLTRLLLEEKNSDEQTHSTSNGRIGNIKYGPPIGAIAEIEKVDNSAIEDRTAMEEDPVENTVDKISDRAAEYRSKSNALPKGKFGKVLLQIPEYRDRRYNGEN